MKLYHGSNIFINRIDLSRSKRGKDFGCGFYLSDNYPQAYEMACLTTEKEGCGTPCVTMYEFDEKLLSDGTLNVKLFEGYSVEWAKFVLRNRKNMSVANIHPYDVVIGPIANDKVGLQIRRFELGDITVEQLVDELRYHKGMTIQYFFNNEYAIKHLQRL